MSDRMLSDEILLGLIKKNGGGGGGTGDYNDLSNQPQIGGVTLKGNKSASDLGLASEENLAKKQNALNAGLYIEIDNDTISVKRDITKTAQELAYNFTIPSDFTLRVKKYVNGDLVDTTDYTWNSVVDPINLDSIMEVSKKVGNYWVVKNLISSTTQAADYSVDLYAMQQSTNYTQNFVATIDADKKLIIKSELDTAINAIKDGQNIDSFADVETALGEKADTDIVASDFSSATSYTAGNYCIYEGKFYRFKNNHSGAWSASDVDEIKIAGELASLKSGLTSVSVYNSTHIIDEHGLINDSAFSSGSASIAITGKLVTVSINFVTIKTGLDWVLQLDDAPETKVYFTAYVDNNRVTGYVEYLTDLQIWLVYIPSQTPDSVVSATFTYVLAN